MYFSAIYRGPITRLITGTWYKVHLVERHRVSPIRCDEFQGFGNSQNEQQKALKNGGKGRRSSFLLGPLTGTQTLWWYGSSMGWLGMTFKKERLTTGGRCSEIGRWIGDAVFGRKSIFPFEVVARNQLTWHGNLGVFIDMGGSILDHWLSVSQPYNNGESLISIANKITIETK